MQGTVNAGGKPLPKGSVVFVPADGAAGHKSAGEVVAGKFLIEADFGPIPGRYKIEVYAEPAEPVALDDPQAYAKQFGRRPPPDNAVAVRFNRQTVLEETVAEAGANNFHFEVQWRRPSTAR